MISVEKALEIILSNITVKEKSEFVDIFNCSGRVLFNNIIAEFNVPFNNNSAMDGYAVISEDIIKATIDNPVSLKIIDEVRAGFFFTGEKLHNGFAVRIMTGAQIPPGADCVIPFEDTVESGDTVNILKKISKNENIRFTGEDIKKGSSVLHKGTTIDSAETGLLSSLNLDKIEVYQKPKVAIISTGDEISEPGKEYNGKTINSNAYSIYSEVKKYGGDPFYYGIIKDNYNDVKNAFLKLLENDIIISSGGVSMGRYDFIPDVLKDIGINLIVKKINMRPGKPVIFGVLNDKIFFGLPGNPVSVMVSFMQFVRPALLKMSGSLKKDKPVIKALLKEDISKKTGRKYFIRGIFSIENGIFKVSTTGSQGSGILSSMSSANCFIVLPEDIEFIKQGEFVDIQLIGHREI